MSVIATIVEGHGEVEAIPVLIRRLRPDAICPRPVRVKRQRVLMPGELERHARIADAGIVDRGGLGGVLLVLDADNACAATDGPILTGRLRAALPHRPVACCLAVREFESWLLAGLDSQPEATDEARGGKAALIRALGEYAPTVDQPKCAARMDIDRASALSRSFRHFAEAVVRLASN